MPLRKINKTIQWLVRMYGNPTQLTRTPLDSKSNRYPKTYLVLNVGHLLSGQLHTVLLHSDSCTGAARMHTCQTYVPEPDLCTGTGLRRGCRAMCRSRSYALTPGLCTGRSTYADAPDLCRGTGFMQTRRTYADAPVLCAGRILCTGARLVRGRRHCAWAPDLCTCA